ncbi:SusC/RagA family TonB-linked outer membrane protein [Sphingobacterium spiritivorum]|uniref:SusC/RagA family TonB-linked outer membrane protein n=1 Tax=Sphingobacterium spiritivorum TaxID=258 RepID=UPI001919C1E5|nr:SusC/RagA family TonB-linked outer membrane protein [Sphingobacterium spiritivorum]QQT26378.1 SusC/RagA family TonB-linked outer membrane protein [Sphingobacterium spiritivorum]
MQSKPKISECDDFFLIKAKLSDMKIFYKIKKELMLLCLMISITLTSTAQTTVRGIVKDENGNALSGVSVKIKNTNNGTSSDENGNYSITVSDKDAVLVFSIISFSPQEIRPNGRTTLNVTLTSTETQLEDVVIVGYGVRKRQDVTGAVAKANLSLQKQSPNGNVMSSLRGTVPGLTVGQVTTAGSDPSIMIRGRNSISGTTSPLIVLDGLIYRGSITSINSSDIASIDLLKDASAAAVYGSQASNGVILITTKSGSGTQDKVIIDYSGSVSFQEMTKKDMRPVSGAGFIQKLGDWYLSESRDPNDMTQMNPKWDPTTKLSVIEADNYKNGYEADWWKLLTNPSPKIQNHNIGISGRSQKINFYLGYGYFDQKNLVKNDNYNRNSIRLNMEAKALDWLTIGAQTGLTINNYSGVSPSFTDLIYSRPYNLPFDPVTGQQLEFYPNSTSPTQLEVLRRSRDSDKNLNLIGNFYVSADIPYIKGLNYRVNLGNNYIYANRFNYNAPNVEATAYKRYMTDYFLTLDNILTYKRDFGKHGIDATLLYGAEINKHDGTQTVAGGILNGALGYDRLDVGDPLRLSASNDLSILPWKEQALYQMARLSYSYNKKYILTGTVRRDGFSGFSAKNKTAVFPSVAFAWRMIDENFIKSVSQINDLKLRVSYGATGNRTVGRYQTLSQMNVGLGSGYLYGSGAGAQAGSFLGQLPNPDLKWETTTSFNTGVDFALFNNRLYGALDLYFSNSKNLLNSKGTPTITGFSSYLINIGKIQNRGQELNINGVPIAKKDFRWEVGVNFFRNRNKVLDIDGTKKDLINGSDPILSFFIGQPYGVVYNYKITGMYQLGEEIPAPLAAQGFKSGQYKIEDTNGDGIITTADKQILGKLDPSYSLSISNSFRYKNVQLKFFINSIQGGENGYLGAPGIMLQNPDNIRNNNAFAFDYWTPNNPDARYRSIAAYVPTLGENFGPYISRSFIRLQDLTLTYSLSDKLIERIKVVKALSIYANVQNLFTITNWDGWDPEANPPGSQRSSLGLRMPGGMGLDANGYPVMKNYSLGVNITF